MSLGCNLACGGKTEAGDAQGRRAKLHPRVPRANHHSAHVHRCRGGELGPPPQSSSHLQQTALTPTLIICRQHGLCIPPTRLRGAHLSYLSSPPSSWRRPPPRPSGLLHVSLWPTLLCLFKAVTWLVCIDLTHIYVSSEGPVCRIWWHLSDCNQLNTPRLHPPLR